MPGIGGGLPLQETVAGHVPVLDLVMQIVEDEIAPVRPDRQHGMALAIRLAHHGDQKIRQRQAAPHQLPALLEHIVFAIPDPGVRIGPHLFLAVNVEIVHRFDGGVDSGIHFDDDVPDGIRDMFRPGITGLDPAFGRICLAEIIMTDRLRRQPDCNHCGIRGSRRKCPDHHPEREDRTKSSATHPP